MIQNLLLLTILALFPVGNGDPTSPGPSSTSRLGELARSLGLGVARRGSAGGGAAAGFAESKTTAGGTKRE